MNAIEQLRQRLLKYPSLSYQLKDSSSITVAAPSPDGFSLTLTATQTGYVVFFDGWHEEFKSGEDALNCFAFGLSDQCRLKVFRRGQRDFKWTVQSRTETGWKEDSTTGLLFFPFWKEEEIVYRQNSVILEEPAIERGGGAENDNLAKGGRERTDFPPIPLSVKGDQVFCPAFDRHIDNSLCWECCMAEQGGPADTAARLRKWIADSQRFASIADFQQVCALCPHCAWRPSASDGASEG